MDNRMMHTNVCVSGVEKERAVHDAVHMQVECALHWKPRPLYPEASIDDLVIGNRMSVT